MAKRLGRRARRILVTGGAGFLGSHLCDALISRGHSVICVDNFLTGKPDNIAHLMGHPRFEFIRHNVTHDLFIHGPLHAIMHFASPASPVDYLNYPIETLKVGALGTHKMLGLARAKGAVFFLASTSEVYGDPQVHPQREDYWGHVNPVGPRGVYDEAKRFGEALCMAYHKVHRIPVRLVRIFNVYGPRMQLRDGRAVPAFISAALNRKPFPVFGNGRQTRSFCYIDDMVDGLLRLLFSDYNGPVNIGNPQEISVLKMAQTIKRLTKSRCPIVHKGLPVDDPKVRQPDITLAKRLLGWSPRVSLEDGLSRTIRWFREERYEKRERTHEKK
ncbi:MAG TPA: SDR family oxidoreductase [Elusimicrobiota bacterium]|nr:SDR family oxidoreductase [Elusimicrobiota bacterium]